MLALKFSLLCKVAKRTEVNVILDGQSVSSALNVHSYPVPNSHSDHSIWLQRRYTSTSVKQMMPFNNNPRKSRCRRVSQLSTRLVLASELGLKDCGMEFWATNWQRNEWVSLKKRAGAMRIGESKWSEKSCHSRNIKINRNAYCTQRYQELKRKAKYIFKQRNWVAQMCEYEELEKLVELGNDRSCY